MPDYELITIVAPELADEALTARLDRVSQLITDRGGEVVRVAPWGGRRRLAYEIGRYREGIYVTHDFRGPASSITEIERALRFMDEVVRHLVRRKLEVKGPRPPRRPKRQPGSQAAPANAMMSRPAPQPAPARALERAPERPPERQPERAPERAPEPVPTSEA